MRCCQLEPYLVFELGAVCLAERDVCLLMRKGCGTVSVLVFINLVVPKTKAKVALCPLLDLKVSFSFPFFDFHPLLE